MFLDPSFCFLAVEVDADPPDSDHPEPSDKLLNDGRKSEKSYDEITSKIFSRSSAQQDWEGANNTLWCSDRRWDGYCDSWREWWESLKFNNNSI